MATLCITTHTPSDPIAQALMLMPNGGPQVRIKVGREHYLLHHWDVQRTQGTDHLLTASWQRWQDIEFMPPSNWYRALLHSFRLLLRR